MRLNKSFNYSEFNKLCVGLLLKDYVFTVQNIMDGKQIIVYAQDEYNQSKLVRQWDAVIHSGSYGHQSGLLEIYGTLVDNGMDNVEGWLKANDILKRL